jgi:tetratricopeptide (TPR) repeat protein
VFGGCLAILYLMSRRYPKAEPLIYQSLAIIQINAGSESPEYAIGAANLGSLYLHDRSYSHALPLLERSVAVLRSRQDHRLEYATALNNLGNVRQQLGEYAEAEACYKEALEILEGSEDRNRLRVAIILEDRAMLLAKMKQHEQAEALYKRSLGLFEGLFGPDSPRLIGVLT